MKLKFTIILSLAFISLSFIFSLDEAYAYNSKHMSNSKLCTRYFTPYENSLKMPRNILRVISTHESGKWYRPLRKNIPWPWTVNVNGRGYYYENKQQAIAAVKEFMNEGKTSIDVGCMQINLKYHPDAFYSLEQAFEPKYNVGYGASLLTKHYKRQKSWRTAIKYYHNRDPKKGKRYLAHIYRTWKKMDSSFKGSTSSTIKNNQEFVPTPKFKSKESVVSSISNVGGVINYQN